MKTISSMWLRTRRCIAELVSDRRGIAATEFAFIVPLMLVMFFGTVELCSGVASDRKVSLMARTLADLTSQNTAVTATQLQNFFNASNAIMWPYVPSPTPNPVNTTITELYIDSCHRRRARPMEPGICASDSWYSRAFVGKSDQHRSDHACHPSESICALQ
jgi:TadE-like protein